MFSISNRLKMQEIARHKIFIPKYNISLEEERELAYRRLKHICNRNIISISDFKNCPENIFMAHEVAGMIDGSLCTKLTVQFNLFGGTVYKMGTDRHSYLHHSIDRLESVGCFGLTELGYGNNAVEMETTATYDPETDEFIINTPTTKAQKYWITNGAVHAHYSVVFAQTYVNGSKEGIHGFLVPIRDSQLNIKKNVKIWDMGYKIGLNGIDNAALHFHNVRIPAQNLLNRSSDVIDGNFKSDVEDSSERKRRRFLFLADQLLSGRICIACMTLGSTKMTLLTTVRYAKQRLGVGPTGLSDTPIFQYQLQQQELVPLLVNTFGLNFFLNHVIQKYSDYTKYSGDHNELLRLCCIIKPMMTWHAERVASKCRERCGGQGFLAANRFGEAISGAHAGITAEGDNRVMLQKVSKELLETVNTKQIIEYSKEKMINTIRVYHDSNLKLLDLYHVRYLHLLIKLAHSMKKAKHNQNVYSEWMYKSNYEIQKLAEIYGKYESIKCFLNVLEKCDDSEKELFQKMYRLYIFNDLFENGEEWIREGFLKKSQLKNIYNERNVLISILYEHVEDMINGFDIPEHMIHAPIAKDYLKYNSYENKGEIN
jgi:acyl-CoA oxidase